MDDQLYREIILEHWKNPQNAGILENADIDLYDTNPLCGDEVRITAVLDGNTLKEIRFSGQGCAISQAAASILTEVAKDMSLDEMKDLSQEAFLENLSVSLTPARLKCALLGYSTLQKGIEKRAHTS